MPQNYNPPGHPPKSGKHVFGQYLDNIELKTLSIPLIIVISYVSYVLRSLLQETYFGKHLTGVPYGGQKCYFGDICPQMSQIARKANCLLYIIQLRLVDIVIYIFKTSDKFSCPKTQI